MFLRSGNETAIFERNSSMFQQGAGIGGLRWNSFRSGRTKFANLRKNHLQLQREQTDLVSGNGTSIALRQNPFVTVRSASKVSRRVQKPEGKGEPNDEAAREHLQTDSTAKVDYHLSEFVRYNLVYYVSSMVLTNLTHFH